MKVCYALLTSCGEGVRHVLLDKLQVLSPPSRVRVHLDGGATTAGKVKSKMGKLKCREYDYQNDTMGRGPGPVPNPLGSTWKTPRAGSELCGRKVCTTHGPRQRRTWHLTVTTIVRPLGPTVDTQTSEARGETPGPHES